MITRAALVLWLAASLARAGAPAPCPLELRVLRSFDTRLPAPAEADVREILAEADRVLRAKLPVETPIRIDDAGSVPVEQLFREVDLNQVERDGAVWRYDFALGPAAPAFTVDAARAQRLKFVERFSLEELANIMPAVSPRTYPAYCDALVAEYHRKMAWLAGLKLPDGRPVIQQPLPPYQSAMDWCTLLLVQDRADIVMTNTLIAYDVTHSPPPHAIFHHAKLGGGAMPSQRRTALNRQVVLVDVFEEYGGIAGICRTDPAVTRSERNRIIGAVLLAHELGHALFALPDVYDHGDACLMNSSAHNLDQREAYRLLTAKLEPCQKCRPWVEAATALATARRAARAGAYEAAAEAYEQALSGTPARLNRERAAYLADLATEALPLCQKAARETAIALCRELLKR